MHGTAASARASCLTAIKFRDELAWFHAFGERMAMTAMRAEDGVFFRQMRTHRRGDGLLPDIGVARAVDKAALVRFREALLDRADGEHRAVERER